MTGLIKCQWGWGGGGAGMGTNIITELSATTTRKFLSTTVRNNIHVSQKSPRTCARSSITLAVTSPANLSPPPFTVTILFNIFPFAFFGDMKSSSLCSSCIVSSSKPPQDLFLCRAVSSSQGAEAARSLFRAGDEAGERLGIL